MKVKRLTIDAMLTAAALMLFVLEAQIPPLIAVPGIKLGLANVVTLLAIAALSRRDAAAILAVRIVLGSMFAGQIMSFLYSLAGGVLCWLAMCAAAKLLSEKQLWAVSVTGAIAHNIGQLAVAFFVLGRYVLYYTPVLLISAVVTGVFTGLCAQFALKYFKRLKL